MLSTKQKYRTLFQFQLLVVLTEGTSFKGNLKSYKKA